MGTTAPYVIWEVKKINKRQREAAERAMLKAMLDQNPKLKKTIDALIENPNPETKDVVEPVILDVLKKVRIEGTQIGWAGFALSVYDKIKDMTSVEEIKSLFREEADKMRKQMGLQGSYFDKNGNVIVEDDG